MKIVNIVFEKKVTKEEKESLGQYSNETLRLEATLGENENRDISILNLMELVHAHLDVPFKSKVKTALQQAMAATKGETVLTEKDTTPSDPKLERPIKVDEAAAEMKKLEERKDEQPEEVKRDATEEPRESGEETSGKKESNDEGSLPESGKQEEKEEKVKTKAKGIPYNREELSHKTDYARIMDKAYEGWRKDPAKKAHVKIISQAMEGKTMYTAAGKISSTFTKEIKKMVSEL